MVARTASWVAGNPGPNVPEDARLAETAHWAKYGISPRTGILWAGNPFLLQSTATMAVQVFPLHFVGSKVDVQGVYVGTNDGIFNLTLAAAPGSGSRTDKVYIMQQDSNTGVTSADATTGPLIAATSGALPAGAVLIGTVVIPAGTTKLTDAGVVINTTCRWTAAAGAPVPVRDITDRGTLPTYTGLQALRLDAGGMIDTYDGTAWKSSAWQDFTPQLYGAMTGTPVAIGTNVTFARYRYLDPHTVQAQVDCSRQAGATITDGLGISLPVQAARRYLDCGTLIVSGTPSNTSGAPATQTGIAYMSGDATKLIVVDLANNYLSVQPNLAVRYSVQYEV